MIRRCYMAVYADPRPRHCVSVDEAPQDGVLYNNHVDLDLPADLDPLNGDADRLQLVSEAYVKGKQEALAVPPATPQPPIRPVTLRELYTRVDHFVQRDAPSEQSDEYVSEILSVALHYVTDADAQKIVADAARLRVDLLFALQSCCSQG